MNYKQLTMINKQMSNKLIRIKEYLTKRIVIKYKYQLYY